MIRLTCPPTTLRITIAPWIRPQYLNGAGEVYVESLSYYCFVFGFYCKSRRKRSVDNVSDRDLYDSACNDLSIGQLTMETEKAVKLRLCRIFLYGSMYEDTMKMRVSYFV